MKFDARCAYITVRGKTQPWAPSFSARVYSVALPRRHGEVSENRTHDGRTVGGGDDAQPAATAELDARPENPGVGSS